MASREDVSLTDRESPACAEGQKNIKEDGPGHGPRVWLFIRSAFVVLAEVLQPATSGVNGPNIWRKE